jgi:curved DNA-binding protein CbpA
MILETFDGLHKTDHYRILGVSEDADRKAIKSAYFQIVANFHPDRYFGKKLGTYKQKLEAIFRRLTEAHDTLTRSETRTEYDRYLESQKATQALDEIVDGEAQSKKLDEIERDIEREVKESERPPARSLTPRPSLSPDERRRAFARKFSSPNIGAPRRPSGPVSGNPTSPEAQQAARHLLQSHYEEKIAQVRAERIRRYVEQADKALESKNLLGAANALRLAVSLSPDDSALAERFAIVERDAAAAFVERYLEQARYDEQRSHFAEAAKSYERALKGRPSANIYERTAHCLVEARVELKKAVELARKAVELAPQTTAYRITLARAFARAGMAQSALGELERARTQDPGSEAVKEWINRVKRGEV